MREIADSLRGEVKNLEETRGRLEFLWHQLPDGTTAAVVEEVLRRISGASTLLDTEAYELEQRSTFHRESTFDFAPVSCPCFLPLFFAPVFCPCFLPVPVFCRSLFHWKRRSRFAVCRSFLRYHAMFRGSPHISAPERWHF